MKKSIAVILLTCVFKLSAQGIPASVEKSIFNVQAGSFGAWVNNESRLSDEFALRTEAGLDLGIFIGSFYEKFNFFMAPVVTLEPRWYYNIGSRVAKSKNILGNSANFLSIKTSYHPDWFVISGNQNINVPSQVSVVPTWGIRRQSGQHFNYEAGFGLGYQHIFGEENRSLNNDSNLAINLHFRMGYTF